MNTDTLTEIFASKCVHFNGVQNKACEAGVAYDKVDEGRRLPYRAALPCRKPGRHLPAGTNQCHCRSLRFPTKEEADAEAAEWGQYMEKMETALKVIDPIRKEQRGKNWQGVIECPNCKGKLHVRHAACNGHVHAKCETDGCVAWME